MKGGLKATVPALDGLPEAADSDANRPPVPIHSDHLFRTKATTDSEAKRPPIPIPVDHFWTPGWN